MGGTGMSKLYDLVIVGAGMSALSALEAGIASARTVVLDYQEHPGGFLKAALPAPGFRKPGNWSSHRASPNGSRPSMGQRRSVYCLRLKLASRMCLSCARGRVRRKYMHSGS